MIAKKGDQVTVSYVGKLHNGQVFDRSPEDRPVQFVVGEEKLIAGFERAVEGMSVGEEKTVHLSADEAYGQYDAALVRTFKKDVITGSVPIKKGTIVRLRLTQGGSILGTVLDVTDDGIVIDVNHPLAGQALSFDIKVLSITSASPA